MPSSTFETLPDEILMIIIRNSGDIFTIVRAFFGLNQRINHILLDKRTHLFSDFLSLDSSDGNINDYYNSKVFHDVSEQLLSLKSNENPQELRRCFEPLVAFHIRRRYYQATDELELGLAHVQSRRMQRTDDELEKIDKELKDVFDDLPNSPMKNVKQIQWLIRSEGARLACTDVEYENFNFADAVNRLLLDTMHQDLPVSQDLLKALVQMFKTLIISNLSLLHNRAYVGNGGCVVYFFLFHVIYNCRSHNINRAHPFIHIQCYQAAVDLLLFVLQCLYYEQVTQSWWIDHYSDLLTFISAIELPPDQQVFIYTSQVEILKILFDENILNSKAEDDNLFLRSYSSSLGNLFICNRMDLISTIFHYKESVRDDFRDWWNEPKFISVLTGNPMRRRLFQSVLGDTSIGTWLATATNLPFILLQKRECRLIKKLFSASPTLIHRLDSDGNDPLLHVCLKGHGCRQRLVEYLLQIGCDVERRNSIGENFLDALRLKRNEKLFGKLIEQETIEIDSDSDEIKIKPIAKVHLLVMSS